VRKKRIMEKMASIKVLFMEVCKAYKFKKTIVHMRLVNMKLIITQRMSS
jgi:hypothetical protein